MNVIWVYKKSILEQIRDLKALMITLLSPMAFIIIFGFFFGQGYYTYNIAISNTDKGGAGQEFIQLLRESKYSNGNQVFKVDEIPAQSEKIEKGLKNREYAAHLYISSDFSEKIFQVDSPKPTQLKITGDPAFSQFFLTELTLENSINKFIRASTQTAEPIEVSTHNIHEAKINSEYDAMAPGLIILSVYFLMVLSAMAITRESENKTLQRLLLSKLKTWEFYGGISLSQLTLAVVVLAIVIPTAIFMGFKPNGSIVLAFFIGCFASLSAIGMGMVIAAFSRNALDAFNIGNVIFFPIFFLSGVVIPPPDIILFQISNMEVGLLSFMPPLSAVSAANKVLINNAGISVIWTDLVLLGVLTLLYWVMGVFLFSRKHKRYR
ncbi:MAG: ABC transporter permease [Cystobacterineae bacterium]|nr:ABC transporter permease [Cystobacterineae bacterium]